MDSCLRFMSLCLSFLAWELIARSESSKTKPNENSSNKQPNQYLAAWEKQVQLKFPILKSNKKDAKEITVSSASIISIIIATQKQIEMFLLVLHGIFANNPIWDASRSSPSWKIVETTQFSLQSKLLKTRKKTNKHFPIHNYSWNSYSSQDKIFFSVSPHPSLSKDPSVLLSVFQGVYQQEKWQQPWQARPGGRTRRRRRRRASGRWCRDRQNKTMQQ